MRADLQPYDDRWIGTTPGRPRAMNEEPGIVGPSPTHEDGHGMNRSGSTTYATSTLDIARLRTFAKRVARETKAPTIGPLIKTTTVSVPVVKTRSVGLFGLRTETYTASESREQTTQVVGPHWVLFTTRHFIDEEKTRRYRAYEYAESRIWILDTAGELLKVWQWQDFTLWDDGRTKRESDCAVDPMTERDILQMDHEHTFSHHHDRDGHYRGDREPGRVIRHAKGVGLSLALKHLLTVR
ncbi:hypothetical protein ACTD5D_19145 [Nocardia takedensis]|uniref:hypothetical protein n=1 Tax=Nocardia takedensis TaxID=259390 RepID=UPI0012F64DD1|nr:hypothetical protein [Nocardia takedensis]